MLNKLKKWWQMFRRNVFVPVLKTAAITMCAVLLMGCVLFGSTMIAAAPPGFEQYVGLRVYQVWLKGLLLYPWFPSARIIQS
jgi:hypothetical protein